jgi:putative protease
MCRLPYTLTDGRGNVLASNQHVLSLKDLNLSDYLSELVDAGVTSFKIEGRLKEASYVKNITAFYRAKIDALMEERRGFRPSSSGKTTFFFTPDPEKTFNRGTTDYFIRGRRHEIVSLRTPKSVGKLLGTVHSVGNGFFSLLTADDLHNGDGICFFGENDELMGININGVEGTRIFPNSMEGIEPGVVVYRNYDHEFVQLLKSDSAKRTIDIDLTFDETQDGFELRAVDEDGNEATHRIVHAKEVARKSDAALATIKTQLSKLGDTIFNAKSVTIGLKQAFFLPVGALNQLRRDCISALEAVRTRTVPRQAKSIVPNDLPYPEKRLDYSANVVNEKAAAFYRRHGVQEIEKGLELQNDSSGKILMTTRHCLKFQFDLCRGEKGSAEELYLSEGKIRYKLDFDCEQCVMRIVAP